MLRRLRPAYDFEIQKWLIENIPNLTDYQKEKINDSENGFVRFSHPYRFFKETKQKASFWWRISLPFYLIVFTLVFISLPFKFLLDGKWGYGKLNWLLAWHNHIFH